MAEPKSPRHVAFGRAVRELRSARGFSQEGLAFKAGLDRTYVSGIERGERNPSLSSIYRITDALDIQLSDLAARAESIGP